MEEDQSEKPRWIDTSAMICDPLAKYGNEAFSSRLVECMESGILDLTPTVTSELEKMRAHKVRIDKALNKSE